MGNLHKQHTVTIRNKLKCLKIRPNELDIFVTIYSTKIKGEYSPTVGLAYSLGPHKQNLLGTPPPAHQMKENIVEL